MEPFIARVALGNLSRGILSQGLGLEIIYTFVIIVCSLMIYLGTKELYELSSHKGIKYFRQAFLFFAIAYFFRSFIKLLLVYFNVGAIFDLNPQLFGILFRHITLLLFMYFSSMAVFYLLYSVMWKRWEKNKNVILLFHFFAIFIAVIISLFGNLIIYFGINILLFIVFSFIVYTLRNRKERHGLYLIYVLLLFFWLLNILDILIPNFIAPFQIFIYLASIFIFLVMLYKVLKKSGDN